MTVAMADWTNDATPPALRDGERMRCPRCLDWWPLWVWDQRRLEVRDHWRAQLLPVYRCPGCRHTFAPLPAGYRLVPEG